MPIFASDISQTFETSELWHRPSKKTLSCPVTGQIGPVQKTLQPATRKTEEGVGKPDTSLEQTEQQIKQSLRDEKDNPEKSANGRDQTKFHKTKEISSGEFI